MLTSKLIPFVRSLFIASILVASLTACWLNGADILRSIAKAWVTADRIEEADAVAVLGGGLDTRPFAAASLYNEGKVKRVLLAAVKASRSELVLGLPNHSETNRAILIRLGVPPDAITDVGRNVSNTYEEARAVGEWAQRSGAKKIIVVTEMFQSRRVQWIFEHELSAKGATTILYALPPQEYDFDHWWKDERGIIEFQNEFLKYLYYRIRY